MSLLEDLANELEADVEILRDTLNPQSVSELVPNYLTFDPSTGLIGADFSGVVHAQGLILPTGAQARQVPASQVAWRDAANELAMFLEGSRSVLKPGSTLTELIIEADSDPNGNKAAGLDITTNPLVGTFAEVAAFAQDLAGTGLSFTVNIIDSAGGSDFAFAVNQGVDWMNLFDGVGRFDAAAAGTYLLSPYTPPVLAANALAGLCVFRLDLTGEQGIPNRTPRLRVKMSVITNATGPGINFTGQLLPVSASAGGAAAVTVTTGAAVATTGVLAPGAGARQQSTGVSVTDPGATYYALAVVLSGAMAANSSAAVRIQLQAHNV